MKYFIQLAYHGGNYHGWQRQKNASSVQEVFENNLSHLLKEETYVIGCGRTDAGVHASEYFAHIKTDVVPHEDFVFRMNKILPPDISVQRIFHVHDKAHAQHDAISRTYTYCFHGHKNPLINQTSVEVDFKKLDFHLIQEALDFIKTVQDFKNVCKHPELYNTTTCHIQDTCLSLVVGNEFNIQITSNRFLRAMMRLLISNILKVGKGRMSLDEFKDGILSESGFKHFEAAPPQGLCLSGIQYKGIDFFE